MVKNMYFISETLPSSRHVLTCFVFTVVHVIGCYCPCFTGKETEALRC